MEKINKTAARFKEVRSQLNLTQQQLADRLILKRNTVAKIESGVTEPSARTLSQLEGLLNPSIRSYTDAPSRVIALNEDQAGYSERRQMPTAQDLHAYLDEVIKAAQDTPAGLSYVWGQMKIHLDLEQIKKLKC